MRTAITIRSITVMILVLASNFLNARALEMKTDDTTLCIRLKGKVSKTQENSGTTYTVELVDNNKVISSQTVKAGKNFTFDAMKDKWYGIIIKKSECVSKLISVNTFIPELQEASMYEVIFEMDEPISELEANYLDKDAIDFPLALISYETKTDNFNYNEEYTKNIRARLLSPFTEGNSNNTTFTKGGQLEKQKP